MKVRIDVLEQVGGDKFKLLINSNCTISEARAGGFINNKKAYEIPNDPNDHGKEIAQGSVFYNVKTGDSASYDEENDKFGDEA